MIPPNWMNFAINMINHAHTAHPMRSLGPGIVFQKASIGFPVVMDILAISSWRMIFKAQLKMMVHRVTKPAWAPRAVVAINSPEPTMEAVTMIPGPMYFSLPMNVVGGSFILSDAKATYVVRYQRKIHLVYLSRKSV